MRVDKLARPQDIAPAIMWKSTRGTRSTPPTPHEIHHFANANLFLEEVEKLVTQDHTPIKALVLDAEAVTDIDTTGAEVLHQILSLLADRGVAFAVARANPQLPPLLRRYGLLELIGEKRFYPTNRHAVAALHEEQ